MSTQHYYNILVRLCNIIARSLTLCVGDVYLRCAVSLSIQLNDMTPLPLMVVSLCSGSVRDNTYRLVAWNN